VTVIVAFFLFSESSWAAIEHVALVVEPPLAPPPEHGMDILIKALWGRGLSVQRLTHIEPAMIVCGSDTVMQITHDDQPPHVDFERVAVAKRGTNLVVTARASDLSGVKSVRLR
jgi:hypothetical protein